ncbi:MAG: hypothetical protein IPL67_14210 [Ignavibacteria bacterium]|nr:hypothetical protein [Ignavibacteria bacterium]
MRRLILQMQTSLDGYVSTGPDDDQSWVTWDIESLKPFVFELCHLEYFHRKRVLCRLP